MNLPGWTLTNRSKKYLEVLRNLETKSYVHQLKISHVVLHCSMLSGSEFSNGELLKWSLSCPFASLYTLRLLSFDICAEFIIVYNIDEIIRSIISQWYDSELKALAKPKKMKSNVSRKIISIISYLKRVVMCPMPQWLNIYNKTKSKFLLKQNLKWKQVMAEFLNVICIM